MFEITETEEPSLIFSFPFFIFLNVSVSVYCQLQYIFCIPPYAGRQILIPAQEKENANKP